MGKPVDKYEKLVAIILIGLIFIVGVFLNNKDNLNSDMKFEDKIIKVNVDSIPIESIKEVQLLDEIFIDYRIKGTETKTYYKGTFSLGNNEEGRVYVHKNSKPYIRINSKEKILIYNGSDSKETIEIYNELLKYIEQKFILK